MVFRKGNCVTRTYMRPLQIRSKRQGRCVTVDCRPQKIASGNFGGVLGWRDNCDWTNHHPSGGSDNFHTECRIGCLAASRKETILRRFGALVCSRRLISPRRLDPSTNGWHKSNSGL